MHVRAQEIPRLGRGNLRNGVEWGGLRFENDMCAGSIFHPKITDCPKKEGKRIE